MSNIMTNKIVKKKRKKYNNVLTNCSEFTIAEKLLDNLKITKGQYEYNECNSSENKNNQKKNIEKK